MWRLMLLLVCLGSVFCFIMNGFASHATALESLPEDQQERATLRKLPQPLLRIKESFVFRAKFYHTRGPCIQDNRGGWAMVAADAFMVIEGDLKGYTIDVRTPSPHGPLYPQELTEGKEYTLRLLPRAHTKEQLRENEQKGYSFLVVDGQELQEIQPSK